MVELRIIGPRIEEVTLRNGSGGADPIFIIAKVCTEGGGNHIRVFFSLYSLSGFSFFLIKF